MNDEPYNLQQYAAMARTFRQLWLAYKAAGFTDEQATRFIEASIKSANNSAT